MTDKRPSRVTEMLWMVPCGYGVLILAAAAWWLATGEPFDRRAYERIGGSSWPAMVRPLTSGQSAVASAIVRLLGGNTGLLAGGLTIAVAMFAFRSGAVWAWFAMWLLPVHALLDFTIVTASRGFSIGAAVWDISLAAGMTATLVASYPRFFVKQPRGPVHGQP